MTALLKTFQQHWSEKIFATGDKPFLLAVSGGMDSMVMAHLFLRADIPFALGHCNFQLRGEEADKDEQLVKNWATQNNITFHSTRFDTKKSSEEWKKGTQETARILRYEWLDGIRQQHNYAAIVTAHHANDNVETLLINLFKGTGIAGLHGIPEKNAAIIRPLLFATRDDIAQYASSEQVSYRDDASNATDDYLRNAVRHRIVPVVNELFPNAVQQVNESIQRFAQAEQLYRKAVEQERKKLIEQRGKDYYIPILKLQQRQPLETIAYELFKPFGFSPGQIPQILDLCNSESGHFIDSAEHRIISNRGFLVITQKETADTDLILVEGFPCKVETSSGSFHFSVVKKPQSIPADSSIAYIDATKLILPLSLRKWKQGDYFYPIGMGMKKKKISKFFKDVKLPIHEKEKVWVLESQKLIAWVAGMRLDERFKIKPVTETVVKIEFRPA